MAIQNEEAKVRITLDIADSEKKVRELQKQVDGLRKSIKQEADPGKKSALKKELEDIQAQYKQTRAELGRKIDLIIDGRAAGASISDLEKAVRKLRRELRDLDPRSDEFTQGSGRLREMQKQLDGLNKTLRPQQGLWQSIGKEVKAFGLIAASYLGVNAIVGQFNNWIRKSAELSDAMANVRKTTGLTEREMNDLAARLSTIDTRTSRKELLQLATEAGKLGKDGVTNIKKFVDEADKIKVALGEDLGEGAVTEIAKLSDLFGEGMLNIASAVNTIGQSSAATEAYQVDFLGRMSGIAVQSKITAAEIQGYAAALELSKVQSETASTALGQFFIEFQRDTEKFGKAAGFARGELEKLITEEGVNAGFISFLKNLKESAKGTDEFLSRLKDIGIDGARGAQTFLALANNIGLLEDQQKLANTAMREGTSVLKEFETKNNTFAGQLERVQKALLGMVADNFVVRGFQQLIGFIDKLARVDLSETLEDERIELQKLQLQLNSTNTTQEDRIRLINELKEKYPGLLKNINAETVSNEELSKSIAEINRQLINRIVIQRKQEELDRNNEEVADLLERRLQLEDEIRGKIVAIRGKYPKFKLIGDTEEEQLANLADQGRKTANVYTGVGSAFFDVGKLLSAYSLVTQKLTVAENENNKILEAKNDLMKRLGVTIEEAKKAGAPVAGEVSVTAEGETGAGSAKKIEDSYRQLLAKLRELRQELIDDELRQQEAAEELRYYNEVASIQKISAATEEEQRAKHEALELAERVHVKRLEEIRDGYDEKQRESAEKLFEQVQFQIESVEQLLFAAFNGEPQTVSLEIDLDKWQTQLDEALNYFDRFANSALSVFNSFAQTRDNKERKHLNEQLKGIDAERVKYKQMLDSKRINKDEYDKKMAELDAQDALRKQEYELATFHRQQKTAKQQAIINAIQSISRTLAEYPYPANLGFAALDAIVAYGKVKEIESTPPPEFEEGGQIELNKLVRVKGASHTAGGMDIIERSTGRSVGNFEGGEGLFIYNKNTTDAQMAALDGALNASRLPGSYFGTATNINSTRISDTIRWSQGFSSPGGGTTTTTEAKALVNRDVVLTSTLLDMKQSIDLLNRRLNRPISASMSWVDFKKFVNKSLSSEGKPKAY